MVPANAGGASGPAMVPRSTVLLFWASWCAPCRAEVGDIAALRQAAEPMDVLVVPIEPGRTDRTLLPGLSSDQIHEPAGGGLNLMLRLTGGAAAALPVSVALDAEGRVCGVHRTRLTQAVVAGWRRRCS